MGDLTERPKDLSVRLAASHVADAIAGTHDGHSVRSGYWYGWWYNLARGRTAAIVGIMLLCFFEKPSWCYADDEHISCGDPDVVLRGVVSNLPIEASIPLEILILLFLLLDSWIKGKGLRMGWGIVKHDKWMGVRVLFAILSLIAVFIDIMLLWASDGGFHLFRLSPILRAGILISVQPKGRETFVAIVRAIPDILNIMVLAILWVLLGAWVAYLMLGPPGTDDGFSTYVKSVNSLQILLTTANYPDVMIPAYVNSRFAFVFFFFFIAIGLWFLLPLTLAVVYNNYSRRKGELDNLHALHRTSALDEAFTILTKDSDGVLSPIMFRLLMRELNAKYKRVNRVIDERRAKALTKRMTNDGTTEIGREQFQNLCDALQETLHLAPEADIPWLSKIEKRFKGGDNWLRRAVLHRRFALFVNCGVVVYAILLITETVQGGSGSATFGIETSLIIFFTVEAILLIWALGIRYFRRAQTLFDFAVLIVTWVFFILFMTGTAIHDKRLARLPMVARSLQFFRLLYRIRTVRVVSDVFFTLVPRFTSVGYAMMCIFTIYALIGVQAFGGMIQVGDPRLEEVTFGPANYYVMNMNDFSSALVTLFAVMVVNNWFIIRDGFAAVTNYWASCFYFIPFYVLTVIIVLNLTIAFIIEAFIGEFSKRSVHVEDESSVHGHRRSLVQAVIDVVAPAPDLSDDESISRSSLNADNKAVTSPEENVIPSSMTMITDAPPHTITTADVATSSSSSSSFSSPSRERNGYNMLDESTTADIRTDVASPEEPFQLVEGGESSSDDTGEIVHHEDSPGESLGNGSVRDYL